MITYWEKVQRIEDLDWAAKPIHLRTSRTPRSCPLHFISHVLTHPNPNDIFMCTKQREATAAYRYQEFQKMHTDSLSSPWTQ
jgi:hypothetical protein